MSADRQGVGHAVGIVAAPRYPAGLMTPPWIRGTLVVYRGMRAAESLLDRLLVASLPDRALAALSNAAFDASKYRTDGWNQSGLFAWESRFVERWLGTEPKRVLVGACGGGREMLELARRGHELVGFDPAPSLVHACAALLEREGRAAQLFVGGYEDLLGRESSTSRRGSPFPKLTLGALVCGGPFDGAILGWGSLTHIVAQTTRESLFGLLGSRLLLPSAPVLASFWLAEEQEVDPRNPVARLLVRFGRRGYRDVVQRGIYGKRFTPGEIEQLAHIGGLEIVEASWQGSGAGRLEFPHVVLRRPPGASRG